MVAKNAEILDGEDLAASEGSNDSKNFEEFEDNNALEDMPDGRPEQESVDLNQTVEIPGNPASHSARSGDRSSGEEGSSLLGGIQQVGGLVDPHRSQTQIGTLGSLQQSNAILFRVKPVQGNRQSFPHPLRIQEATYNQYRSGVWNALDAKFTPQPSQGDQHWVLDSHSSLRSVKILEILNPVDGVLKLPVGTSEVKGLDVETLTRNQYGAVSFQRQAGGAPLSYEAKFDPNRLVDSPPTPLDRVVPAPETKALNAVLKTLKLNGKSETQKVQAVSSFFGKNFQYSLELPQPPNNKTPIAAFLQDHRSGHCEYFASATSLLLRSAGIPTRYVVGYSVSEYSPTEQEYIVRVRDAHAWVMAYVDHRWITVDTTPSGGASQDRNGQETVEELIAQRTPAINPINNGIPSSDFSGSEGEHGSEGDRGREDDRSNQSEANAQRDDISSESWHESLQEAVSDIWSAWMDGLQQKFEDLWTWSKAQYVKVADSIWFGAFLILGGVIALGAAFGIWRLYRPAQIASASALENADKINGCWNLPGNGIYVSPY